MPDGIQDIVVCVSGQSGPASGRNSELATQIPRGRPRLLPLRKYGWTIAHQRTPLSLPARTLQVGALCWKYWGQRARQSVSCLWTRRQLVQESWERQASARGWTRLAGPVCRSSQLQQGRGLAKYRARNRFLQTPTQWRKRCSDVSSPSSTNNNPRFSQRSSPAPKASQACTLPTRFISRCASRLSMCTTRAASLCRTKTTRRSRCCLRSRHRALSQQAARGSGDTASLDRAAS
jgi:hypothetical protein